MLHGCLVAGALTASLCAAPGIASAEQSEQYVRLLGEDFEVWKVVDGKFELTEKNTDKLRHCDYHLSHLTEWNAPDSLTFELEHDTPDLKAGKHRWTEAREACDNLMKIALRMHKVDRITALIFDCQENMSREPGNDLLGRYLRTRREYDETLAAGIPATEVIHRGGVTGTMKELFDKWCVTGQAKLQAVEDAREAPYKKRLKNDKLRIALDDEGYITLPGRVKVTAEQLAAANVWFEDASPDKVCPNGAKVHVLHRYQFNAQQKLAKVTDREFCGSPPDSALH